LYSDSTLQLPLATFRTTPEVTPRLATGMISPHQYPLLVRNQPAQSWRPNVQIPQALPPIQRNLGGMPPYMYPNVPPLPQHQMAMPMVLLPPPLPGGDVVGANPQHPMPSMDEGPKLKEPDVFMGKDANKLTPFLTQCIQWFIAQPRKFQSQ
jgi:hypothetical protein